MVKGRQVVFWSEYRPSFLKDQPCRRSYKPVPLGLAESRLTLQLRAYLVRSLSADPTNDAALTWLASLLEYRTWMLPKVAMKLEGPVNSVEFNPDGTQSSVRMESACWSR